MTNVANFKIATWNVNSIKVRQDQVLEYLQTSKIDTLILQELKCTKDMFPCEKFKDNNYNLEILGQPTYNGVAVISKHPIKKINCTLYPEKEEESARFLHVLINNINVICVYFPNGNPIDTPKFEYKIEFTNKVIDYVQNLMKTERDIIIGGDFNIALLDKDVYSKKAFVNDAIFLEESRSLMQHFLNIGLYDTFRTLNNDKIQFSWWSYQNKGYQNNYGALIDYILASPYLIDRLQSSYIDQKIRENERPSDHCPVVAEFCI